MTWGDALGPRRVAIPKAPVGYQRSPSSVVTREERYATAALENECAEVSVTGEGARNDRLNAAAFSLGQLVAAGALPESAVWEALREAARACGLGASETEATIASGLAAGKKEPRPLPESRPIANGNHGTSRAAGVATFDDEDDRSHEPYPPRAPAEVASDTPEAMAEPAQEPTTLGPVSIVDVFEAWRNEGPLVHEPTTLAQLDELTGGGPVYGTRWYLSGAPDAGKTALLLMMAHVYLERGVAVGLLAVDEEAGDLVTRLAQRIGYSRQHCEARDHGVLAEMQRALEALPLRLYDDRWTIERAAADMATFARKRAEADPAGHPYGPRAMLGIDSVQTVMCDAEHAALLGGRPLSTNEAVTARVRAIRAAATQHRLIVMATSELNRGAYSGDPEKQTSTMAAGKWSGSIEYSARVLLGLRSVAGESDLLDLEIAKNKHGPRDRHIYLTIDRRSQTLTETTYEPPPDNRASQRAEKANVRNVTDAAWVAVVLAEKPGLTARNLAPAVRSRSGEVTRERTAIGLSKLGAAAVVIGGPRGAQRHYLDGIRVPADVLEAVPESERPNVLAARAPREGENVRD